MQNPYPSQRFNSIDTQPHYNILPTVLPNRNQPTISPKNNTPVFFKAGNSQNKIVGKTNSIQYQTNINNIKSTSYQYQPTNIPNNIIFNQLQQTIYQQNNTPNNIIQNQRNNQLKTDIWHTIQDKLTQPQNQESPVVERPHFDKSFNNISDRRQLGADSDPSFNKTCCSPWLVGILALLALIGLVLGIVLAFTTGTSGPFLNGFDGSITDPKFKNVEINNHPTTGPSVISQKTLQVSTPIQNKQPTSQVSPSSSTAASPTKALHTFQNFELEQKHNHYNSEIRLVIHRLNASSL